MKRRTVLAGLGATAAAGVLGMPSILKAQAPITLNGAVQFNDDHAFNKALRQIRRAGAEILRQAGQFHAAQELVARAREAVFRVHVAGQGGRLRHRLAGPHVDLRQGGALHRRAVRVQGHRAHEQGGRSQYPGADRRRSRGESRGDADRLFAAAASATYSPTSRSRTWPISRASRCACRARRSGRRHLRPSA